MAKTAQKNFRMSSNAVALLKQAANKTKRSETEVNEYCIAKYALEMNLDIKRVEALILELFAKRRKK